MKRPEFAEAVGFKSGDLRPFGELPVVINVASSNTYESEAGSGSSACSNSRLRGGGVV